MQDTQETLFQSPGLEGSLEEEMAAQACTPARKTPWTEEPRRLQATGLQRIIRTFLSGHAELPAREKGEQQVGKVFQKLQNYQWFNSIDWKRWLCPTMTACQAYNNSTTDADSFNQSSKNL